MTGPARGAGNLKVTARQVLAAVESLYADEVRPCGRILLKRLGEQLASQAGATPLIAVPGQGSTPEFVPRIDTRWLRKVCERCGQLCVLPEAATDVREYAVFLAGRGEGTFVDQCSEQDPYAEEMWTAAAAHFAGPGAGAVLPGGRYACARALAAACLPFLAGRSLGEVCHIVQLAISRRQLLGYLDGAVVPYGRSEAVVKQRCAALQQPAAGRRKDGSCAPAASLEQARACLMAILEAAPGAEPGEVPLPNVKRLFRSRFELDLSETFLGHTRLSDMLQDQRFADICELHLRGGGYVVRRPPHSVAVGDALPANACDNKRHLASDDEGSTTASGSTSEEEDGFGSIIQRTFIHFTLPPPTPPCGAVRRSSSLPRDHRANQMAERVGSAQSQTGGRDELDAVSGRTRFCPDEPLCLDEAGPIHVGRSPIFPLMTPSPQYEAPVFVPRAAEAAGPCRLHLSLCMGLGLSIQTGDSDALAAEPPSSRLIGRVQFCVDSPLQLEEAGLQGSGIPLASPVATPSPQYEWTTQLLRAADAGLEAPEHPPKQLISFGGSDVATSSADGVDGETKRERVRFCSDAPLVLEDALPGASSTADAAASGFCLATPSPLSPRYIPRPRCLPSFGPWRFPPRPLQLCPLEPPSVQSLGAQSLSGPPSWAP